MSKHWFVLIFSSLIGLWVVMSFARLTYNYFKYFNGELYLYTKSDNEKRKIYFGDRHDLSNFIISKTPKNSRIMFYEPDPRSFFLISYYVYPRLIFPGRSIFDAKRLLKTEKIDYIFYYGEEKKWVQPFPSYKIFEHFRGAENNKMGLLLRKR